MKNMKKMYFDYQAYLQSKLKFENITLEQLQNLIRHRTKFCNFSEI